MNILSAGEVFNKARRKNQAYQTYYGPEAKVTNAITRDLAANKVIERQSWFPSIATGYFFSRPEHFTKHNNMDITSGRVVTKEETSRSRARPGQIAYQSQFGDMPDVKQVQASQAVNTHTMVYVLLIIIAIVFISMLF